MLVCQGLFTVTAPLNVLILTVPLVRPLMMPSRHLREKANILFPSEEHIPFLADSAEEKAREKRLAVGFPFPNITLADMLRFMSVTQNKGLV